MNWRFSHDPFSKPGQFTMRHQADTPGEGWFGEWFLGPSLACQDRQCPGFGHCQSTVRRYKLVCGFARDMAYGRKRSAENPHAIPRGSRNLLYIIKLNFLGKPSGLLFRITTRQPVSS